MIRHNDKDELVWEWRFNLTVLVVVLAFVLIAVLAGFVIPAAGATNNSSLNETAPYYGNQTAVGNQSDWLPGEVTLDTIGNVSSRLGPYVIGTGEQIPGGTTYAGTIITGLVMVGIFIGAVGYTSAGAAAGAVVAAVAGYGLVEVGLAPQWLRLIVLVVIGAVAAVAVYRLTK